MKDKLTLIAIILAGIIAGCAWLDKNAPWLGAKAPGKKKSATIPPKHKSVIRPQDGLFVTEPATKPATRPEPVIRPIAETRPGPVIRPIAETRPGPVIRPVAETRPGPVIRSVAETRRGPVVETAPATEPIRGEVVAASMVQVNDHFITIEHVLKPIAAELAKLPVRVSETTYRQRVVVMIDEEVRRQIIQHLVLAEARVRLTDQQKGSINREMREALSEMIAGVGGSRQKLEAKFIREGTTLDAATDEQRKELEIKLYERTRFIPTISVTGQMLWRYYNSHRADYTTPKQVQMQIIAAPVRAFLPDKTLRPTEMELRAAKARAKQVIDKAVRQLVDGQSFGEVAKRLSRGIKAADGGLWDIMPKGNLRADWAKVEQIAFMLEEGQMAGPIEIAGGYYVVKAKKVQPGKAISYEDAQVSIEDTLREQQFDKVRQEYYEKLVKAATIIQAKDFLRMATDRAVEKYRRE